MPIPNTRPDLEALGYKYMGEGRCRGCGAVILWFETPRNKRMPMSLQKEEFQTDPNTDFLESHHAVCPKVEQFRRPK